MTVHTIISACAVILFVLDMLWFAVRIIKSGRNGQKVPNTQNAGKTEKGFAVREVLIYVCSVVIILLCFFMDFGMTGNIVLNACALLAAEIANRQLLTIDKEGDF